MPPKQKFNAKEVLEASLNLMRREGMDRLTARGLGAELGVSSRPIFTVFKNMEEVRQETVKAAKAVYNEYVEHGLAEDNPFKSVGMQYIRFAREEPRLFGLLFMTESEKILAPGEILPVIDDNSEKILASVQTSYGLTRDIAYNLYQNMWIFTHGIACLCATGVSRLTEDEAGARLTEMFTGQLIKIKSEGRKND